MIGDSTHSTPPRLPRSALLGSLVGFMAWAVALGVLLATNADAATFWRLTPLACFVSLGLWALVWLAVDGTRRRCGVAGIEPALSLLGGILFALGSLLALAGEVILPTLARYPDVLDVLRATGSSTSLPPFLCVALLGGGACLLARVGWRSQRRA